MATRAETAGLAARRHLGAAIAALDGLDPAVPTSARDVALAELRAARADQSAFLHAVAHDLRNPLTAIRGQVQLLRRRSRRSDATDLAAIQLDQGLQAIEIAVDRAIWLVARLLDPPEVDEGRGGSSETTDRPRERG